MHYREFESSLDLNSDHLLYLGMCGPKVNKKFARILAKEFDESNSTQLLDLGTFLFTLSVQHFGKY